MITNRIKELLDQLRRTAFRDSVAFQAIAEQLVEEPRTILGGAWPPKEEPLHRELRRKGIGLILEPARREDGRLVLIRPAPRPPALTVAAAAVLRAVDDLPFYRDQVLQGGDPRAWCWHNRLSDLYVRFDEFFKARRRSKGGQTTAAKRKAAVQREESFDKRTSIREKHRSRVIEEARKLLAAGVPDRQITGRLSLRQGFPSASQIRRIRKSANHQTQK